MIAWRAHEWHDLADPGHGLTLPFQQHRLVVEGVDLTHPSVTEDRDNGLGLGRKVLRSRRKRIDRAGRRLRQPPILTKQIGEGDTGDSATEARQQFTA
ncbi:MAG: hypothetical protein ACK5TZ_00285 [bacterium]